jgi:carbon-monoxide dehydrogenase small subunit
MRAIESRGILDVADTLCLHINGAETALEAEGDLFLLDLLRNTGLTAAKEGCGEGECGSCTVLIDGVAVRSCLVFAHSVRGSSIETVEGLATDAGLHPLQTAFHGHSAVQCGYCTPGLLMQAKALLEKNLSPSDEEIRFALAGNLCRCTGYQAIVAAVQAAATEMRKAHK